MKKLLILSVLFLAGCSGGDFKTTILRYKEPLSKIATWINKIGVIAPTGETTPIVFNGAVYLIHDAAPNFEILDENGALIHFQNASLEYISGFENNGVAYVFGSKHGSHDKILMQSSTDLINWSQPVEVLRGGLLFNTSVTITPLGFTMAVEFLANDIFRTKFYTSADLINWEPIGSVMMPEYYGAAPILRYVSPYYYVIYTSESDPAIHHSWNLNIARSSDLTNWQDSLTQVIAASNEPQNNASDLDMVEFNGVTKIYYLNTSQSMQESLIGAGLIKAEYAGSLAQFCEEFFK